MSSVAALLLALVSPGLALVPPGQGTLAQGLAEMRRLSEAEKPDEALALADRLLAPGSFAQWRERATAAPGWKRTVVEAAAPLFEAVGLSDLSGPERAAVHFARGVVLANAKKTAESDAAFEQARALSGPGELRFDASYDLGWNALSEGEAQRATIPELGGQPPPQAANQAAPQPGQPDPLQLARAAYTQALGRFVECLKLDARDGDTRANAELARKRLRELAEIQKKREEEKQKQEQQKKDQEKKDQDQKNQDKKDQDKQNQDKQDPQQKKDSSEDKDKKNSDDQPKKDEEADKPKPEKKEAQPQPAKEEQLTKEEIMRILDTLKDREEEGKKLLEQLRRARRAKVKRDW